jgi:hypothetical protein
VRGEDRGYFQVSVPEYQQLMARTRRFLPWPPLAADKIAANEKKIAAANATQQAQEAAGTPDEGIVSANLRSGGGRRW